MTADIAALERLVATLNELADHAASKGNVGGEVAYDHAAYLVEVLFAEAVTSPSAVPTVM